MKFESLICSFNAFKIFFSGSFGTMQRESNDFILNYIKYSQNISNYQVFTSLKY